MHRPMGRMRLASLQYFFFFNFQNLHNYSMDNKTLREEILKTENSFKNQTRKLLIKSEIKKKVNNEQCIVNSEEK